MKTILRLLGLNSDFQRLFYINEYAALAGEKKRTILALILILFLTLLALGYAVGGIQNLERKMNNPFTNWVDLNIIDDRTSQIAGDIRRDYMQAEKQEAFQIDNVKGWVKFNYEFYDQSFDPTSPKDDSKLYGIWGRSIEADDKLIGQVLSGDNLIWKHPDLNLEEVALENCEIMITEELMKKLEFDLNRPDIGGIFMREGDGVLFLKVVAVVRELPSLCKFACSPEFYNIRASKFEGIRKCGELMSSNFRGKRSGFNFIASANVKASELKKLAKLFFVNIEAPEVQISEVLRNGANSWNNCEFSFLPSETPTQDSIDLFLAHATAKGNSINRFITVECGTGYCTELDSDNYHYLAFNFNRLDDIRKFKDDINDTHKLIVDMSLVEAKENFALVGRLTLIISLILLAFGILSIILFVNNLLKSHLFKVRSNLGTFKAFGLSNHFLNTIYLKIIFSFLILSILIALGITVVIDRVEQAMFLDESKFNVFSSWVLFALIGLVIISLIISYNTIKKILGDTPGNLIYER